jgi:hypothetical protein
VADIMGAPGVDGGDDFFGVQEREHRDQSEALVAINECLALRDPVSERRCPQREVGVLVERVVAVAVGTYEDTTTSNQAMVVSSVASLAVATSSLPSGVAGSSYSAQLVSAGGAGADTWSVSSGALPAGLSLNAATGVISGVPSVVGTSSFTVSVSDPGPPAQQASASFSIGIGAVKVKGPKAQRSL